MPREPLDPGTETAPAPPAPRGPRREVHSEDMPIEQKPIIADPADREGEIVEVNSDLINQDYLAELAFMEEPVTIRLEPGTQENADPFFPVWVNGKPAEVFQRGRWEEVGYLSVGRQVTVKRKTLEVIVRAKVDSVRTEHEDAVVERPRNWVRRTTSAIHSFSVIRDDNPRGAAWLEEMRRRNF